MPRRVIPSCRYEHGPLQREERWWAVQQMERITQPPHPEQNFLPMPVRFVFSLFRCPACGYLELFDDEDAA